MADNSDRHAPIRINIQGKYHQREISVWRCRACNKTFGNFELAHIHQRDMLLADEAKSALDNPDGGML